ncbi:MAG: hypothetical protein ABIJ28_03465 [Patescibacteria group bacterium]
MHEGDFFTRHSIRPKEGDQESPDFEGVSEKGVELAKQRAREILESLEQSENGTIMFIGGTSEIVRTKSTAVIYGNEMRNIVSEQKRDDVLVFVPEDLENIEGYSNKVDYLVKQITANPEKKIIIDFPLFIKEFSFVGDFTTEEGKWTQYTREMLKRSGGDSERFLKDWLDNQGVIGDLEGPNPKEIAEKQLAGLNRLREFVEKYISGRPLIIGSVGHSWSLDALAVYLANKGEVTAEAFDKMKAKMIGDTEMIKLTQKDGKQVLQYGELFIPLEEELKL